MENKPQFDDIQAVSVEERCEPLVWLSAHWIGAVRVLVSLGLLYGVYLETGVWTTLACFLMMLRGELDGRS